MKGGRRQGGQRKRWVDNIREWTGLEFGKSQRAVENREKWRKLVAKSHQMGLNFCVFQLPTAGCSTSRKDENNSLKLKQKVTVPHGQR